MLTTMATAGWQQRADLQLLLLLLPRLPPPRLCLRGQGAGRRPGPRAEALQLQTCLIYICGFYLFIFIFVLPAAHALHSLHEHCLSVANN
jgi:hypothetical protein